MREYCGETFSKLDRAGEGLSSRLFEDCLFTGCRLEGALVENCQFSGCRFEGCKITAPKFRGTQMLSCDFADCALSGVDWSALLDERKRGMGFLPFDSLRGCSLRHCVFFGLDLKGFQFAGADLSGSFFDGCKLEEASFAGCRLQERLARRRFPGRHGVLLLPGGQPGEERQVLPARGRELAGSPGRCH